MESSTMHEAYEEIKRLSQDPKTRGLAMSREKFINDQVQREIEARRDGIEEGKKEVRKIVLNLYEMNIPVDTISKAANISVEKVMDMIEAKRQ